MHQALEMLFVLLVLSLARIQSRPLDELNKDIQPTTTTCIPPNCLYESKCYAHEEEITHLSDGEGWCYGLLCNGGHALAWDDFDCGPVTTIPPTTITPTPPTTTPPSLPPSFTTTPFGCNHGGSLYPPGSEISKGSDGNGWCYGLYCDYHGSIIAWDNWDCSPSSTKKTSSAPTTTPPSSTRETSSLPSKTHQRTTKPSSLPPIDTTPFGCNHEGSLYPPGSKISEGSDGNGWCYETYCNYDGNIITSDNWDCSLSATKETSSAPTTFPPQPTQLGCLQNGVWYAPGSEISRGSDGQGWCYGLYCTDDGQLQMWDDFNCTTESTPAPKPPAQSKGCYHEGEWYPPGVFEGTNNRGCRFGVHCGLDGQVTHWEEFDCQIKSP